MKQQRTLREFALPTTPGPFSIMQRWDNFDSAAGVYVRDGRPYLAMLLEYPDFPAYRHDYVLAEAGEKIWMEPWNDKLVAQCLGHFEHGGRTFFVLAARGCTEGSSEQD